MDLPPRRVREERKNRTPNCRNLQGGIQHLSDCSVPAGATAGFVTLTTPGGTLTSNKVFRVTPSS
jgi:hypothetical protein